MQRHTWPALVAGLALACSDSGGLPNPPDQGSTGPDLGPDGGNSGRDLGLDAGTDGSVDMGGSVFPPGVLFRGSRRIQGVDLQIEVAGSRDAPEPPVVILNMAPELGYEYLRGPMRFLRGPSPVDDPERMVVFADLPAQGRSQDLTTDGSTISIESQYQGLVDILADLRTDFLGQAPVDVIGHGYGALVASLLAAREPQEVRRLVLVAPYAPEVQTWRDFQAEIQARLGPGENTLIAELTNWGSGTECMRDLDQCTIQIFQIEAKYWVCRPENTDAFRDINVLSANWTGKQRVEQELRRVSYSYVDELANVSAPTTLVLGECDPTVPTPCQGPDPDPQRCSLPNTWDLYLQQLQNRRAEFIDTTGYFPMVEAPDAFQQVVLEALEGPPPSGQN